ncbi:hypothetical protein CANINC_004053 [Pichia inconspicua]|uniref:Uncharacterized protein n=1 Tax=Pichia inconspicua TaxID=52247 RepID=A0A4T0WX31_9ASCO|nr:hypothetical protein CANINC_004053 [[Candida] inconspicua]
MNELTRNIYETDPDFRPTRLVSLFSDYKHLEEVNYEGFKANLQTWKRVIVKLIDQANLLVLNYYDLQKQLTYTTNTGEYIPQGLYIALEELVKDGKLEYIKPKGTLGYLRWMVTWDIRKQKLICVDTVKKIKDKVKGEVNELHMKSLLGELGIEDEEKIVVESQLFDIEQNPITNINFAIYQVENCIATKNKEINRYKSLVKESIREKNLDNAKSQLKISKIMEMQRIKALERLEQLHLLKSKIEESENNKIVIESLNTGNDALKSLSTDINEVEDLVEELNDEVHKVDSVSDLLGQSVTDESTFKEDDIDEELRKIENEEAEMDQTLKDLEDLKIEPSVKKLSDNEKKGVDDVYNKKEKKLLALPN